MKKAKQSEKYIHTTIVAVLVTARHKLGWPQKQLAEQLGIAPQTVSRWERGANRPYIHHLQALCDLFDKTFEEQCTKVYATTQRLTNTYQTGRYEQLIIEHRGLQSCFHGWIESLKGRHEQAEHCLRQACDAFAMCNSAFASVLQELRDLLESRSGRVQLWTPGECD
ncbi:MAG TPA: helix-turn-helix transcriptional regulator [Ktedonobacteraceae bacterium]|jgi:transcriptional regulator with XRE-family HTH domain